MEQYSHNTFFDISEFPYKGVFENVYSVWEAIGRLKFYIDELFSSKIIQANYQKAPLVFLGKNVVIDEGIKIEGPAIIGDNSVIRHGALLRAYCLLGNNVIIGHGCEIKHSIFLNNASAAHLNYVGDSIIGNNVNIAGGAITANFRLDKQKVRIKHGTKILDTQLEKLGAVIGDGSNIGVNAVLNPGTLLGKNTIVYPLTSVRGVHDNNAIIK